MTIHHLLRFIRPLSACALGLTCLGFGLPSAANAGLVAHYPFDGDVLDASGNGNHGTFRGGRATFEIGRDGNPTGAITLDGVNDYIELTHKTKLPLSRAKRFTIAVWVKGGNNGQQNKKVYSEGSSTDDKPLYNFGTPSSGDGGQVDVFVRSSIGVEVNHERSDVRAYGNAWHHIAVADNDNIISIYVDGVLQSTKPKYGQFFPPAILTDRTGLGAVLRTTVSNHFKGALDDVRLYDHALNAAAIAEVIAETDPNTERIYSGGVTYAQFDEADRIPSRIKTHRIEGVNGAAATQVLQTEVPKNSLVSVQYSPDLQSGWKTIGEPELVLDGMAEITAPQIGDGGFFRLVHEPFPAKVVATGANPLVVLDRPVSPSNLEYYLRSAHGIGTSQVRDGGEAVVAGRYDLKASPQIGFDVLDTSGVGAGFTNIDWGIIRPTQITSPKLSAIVGGKAMSKVKRQILENFNVPATWTIARSNAAKAKWIIQRTPFPVSPAYRDPAPQSVTGEVSFSRSGFSKNESVTFELDFGKQSFFGVEEGMKFYARLFEMDAGGNVLGVGSNVVTFEVEATPELPVANTGEIAVTGKLTLENSVLGCFETTDGGGDDEVKYQMWEVEFDDDEVRIKQVVEWGGFEVFSENEVIKPSKLFQNNRNWADDVMTVRLETDLPDTWIVYALIEEDVIGFQFDPVGPQGGTPVPRSRLQLYADLTWPTVQKMSEKVLDAQRQFADGARGVTLREKRQSWFCRLLMAEFAEEVADETVHEVFARTWFQITEKDLRKAITKGQRKKTFSLRGDGAEYAAEFLLKWYPK